jgi:biotin carboxyl carrier protein
LERFRPEVLDLIYEGRLGDSSFRIEVEVLAEVNGTKRLEIVLKQGDDVKTYQIELLGRHKDRWTLNFDSAIEDFVITTTNGTSLVDWKGKVFPVEIHDLKKQRIQETSNREPEGKAAVRSQMPGKVIEFLKKPGDPVEAGDGVVVVEAMKMQNEVRAPKTGRVASCFLEPGDSVKAGDVMFEIE